MEEGEWMVGEVELKLSDCLHCGILTSARRPVAASIGTGAPESFAKASLDDGQLGYRVRKSLAYELDCVRHSMREDL